jgi:adenosylcobyric acid synthase
MPGRTLMIQGTMSSVGKSLLVAALCRIFRQDGLHVAPFKAQNMALNSFATRDGREVGRSQAMQAAAAGVDVTVEMNPVLIKPEADAFAQVVVLGRPWARVAAGEYMRRRGELWGVVTGALDALRAEYDLVVIEGAGSPVELNLRRGDLVNMPIAAYADAPVLLVGDIDRGGVFAQLLGTLMLLEADERARVRGLVVNKFRGDRRLFEDGVAILEQRGGVPVLGVVPFIPDLRIADEDSVALDDRVENQEPRAENQSPNSGSRFPVLGSSEASSIEIAVIRLPCISNFDDFDALRTEPRVAVRFVAYADELGTPDLLILPGTKTTVADLAWLRQRGLAKRIIALAWAGVPVLGICGGYQMLGAAIRDPLGVEADVPEVPGLGLLPVETTFAPEKRTERARARIAADAGLFAGARGIVLEGYEIHMGHTALAPSVAPLAAIVERGGQPADDADGAVAAEGWIAGTYLHGLFDDDRLRHAILGNLAARKGLAIPPPGAQFDRQTTYDRLAAAVRENIDLDAIYRLIANQHRFGCQ